MKKISYNFYNFICKITPMWAKQIQLKKKEQTQYKQIINN
jgi:hypothetical protein